MSASHNIDADDNFHEVHNDGNPNEGGDQSIPLYGSVNPSLKWRTEYFGLSRSKNDKLLFEARDTAFGHKLAVIDKFGRRSGSMAGYDPAGAGSPWYSIGPRNVNGRIKSIAVHPTNPNIIFAGAAAGGVWKSIDGGQTWDPLWDMQESLAIGSIAIADGSPNTIYVGTGEWTLFGGTYAGAGVYVSTDAGVTWSRRPAVNSRRIAKVVVDPTNAQQLWVCGNSGLEHSTNGGITWTTLLTKTVTDVVLDPLNSTTVYTAVASDGFYKSTDSGTTFNLLPGAPSGAGVQWPQMAIGKAGSHKNNFILIRISTTLQSSIDGGQTFTTLPGTHGGTGNVFVGWNDACAVAPDDESILFWGGVGLDRTTNSGTTWTSLGVHADQHAMIFAPSNTNIVYFANDGGVYRSDDKGATVRQVSHGLVITQFYDIGFWSQLSNVIGGGSQDTSTNFTTSGLTWKSAGIGGDGGWFLIDSTDPRIMYGEYQSTFPGNIKKTTDGGLTWVDKTAGIVGTQPWLGILTMDPTNHLTVFYGTDRVLRSTDGLATPWTQSSQTLIGLVSAIAIAPASTSRIYAGTSAGKVYRSDDGGNTQPWADKSATLPPRPITSITTTGDNVLVTVGGLSGAASSQSLYYSTDGGTTWKDVSGDLPGVVANSVVIDPSVSTTYYLATDTGIWRSTNSGTNWLAFDNGIPNVVCSDLALDAASKILYCGTFGRGAYKLDVTPNVMKKPVDLYVRDDDLDTGERFPSPSNLPDPLVPSPGRAQFWQSPDIKVNHIPVFTPTGVFDGVDFDETLVHQDLYRGQSNRFFVQVHNRGWQSTQNVSVRAFIADASAGLPNLPNALVAPNFDLVNTTHWMPVGVAQKIPVVNPNRPVIVYWDFTVPIGEATHTCCLVVLSSPDDPLNNSATNIAQLVTGDKHTCLRNLHVIDPGPGGMPPKKFSIDFHNPFPQNSLLDIVIRPNGFALGAGLIGLLLPKFSFAETDFPPLENTVSTPLAKKDPVGGWYIPSNDDKQNREAELLLQKRLAACDRSRIFGFNTNSIEAALRGIKVAAGQTLKGIMVVTLKTDVYLTGPVRFDVIQLLDGKIAGGSTFQFGYDLPAPGTVMPCRRIRITADSISWGKHGGRRGSHEGLRILMAKVMVADNPDRICERLLRVRGGDEHDRHPSHDHMQGVEKAPEAAGKELEKSKPKDQSTILFDGMIQEGNSLAVSIISIHAGKDETLFSRRFDGAKGIRFWLGEYDDKGKGGLEVKYGIDEIQEGGGAGESD